MGLGASALGLAGMSSSWAQSPPAAPLVTEPEVDGQVVHAADVHMETGPFSDPDGGDVHLASDWEIWSTIPVERVWAALGITDIGKTHIHLADGAFEGSLGGAGELLYSSSYRLRARHEDQTGLWSDWSERLFDTGPLSEVFPLELADVAPSPAPSWVDEGGLEVVLPVAGGQPGFLRVDSAAGALLLAFEGYDGTTNQITNPPGLGAHVDVRIVVSGGSSPLLVVPSKLVLTDEHGSDTTIWLPSFDLEADESAYLWAADNQATFWGDATQTEPDLSVLARSAPVPWTVQAGFAVDVVASGFKLPVNIAFVPQPGGAPEDPRFYVSELYGSIKVVANDGTVSDYATDLLNYDPGGGFPGAGEQGLSGLVVDPTSGDLIAAMLHDAGGPHYPRVVRCTSVDGGKTAASQTILLDMVGESQGQSHFISTLTIGPDGRLYVHMGDGFDASRAQDLSSFRGKVLRMELDGRPATDNPYYDLADGIDATDYVYSWGVRNPFGGRWRALDGRYYEVENGPSRDRMAILEAGKNLGWDGSNGSMALNAIYSWLPSHGPVNIAFVEPGLFGGSEFPASKFHHAFVTESGPTYAKGRQALGKRIVEFEIDPSGVVVGGPLTLVEYDGNGRASAAGLAAGPDGLYFTDLYKDQVVPPSPTAPGSNVLRVRWVGEANFYADVHAGRVPLTVPFHDRSIVPGASQWRWFFGDGSQASERDPVHVYTEEGVYTVRLDVAGSRGVATTSKEAIVIAGAPGSGLTAEYFPRADLSGERLLRTDRTIDFVWGFGSPDPELPVDGFSARWSGRILPYHGETYTFHLTHDDGVRLWIDGALVIDAWASGAPYSHSGSITLAPSKHDIVLEYFESDDFAYVTLEWESAHTPLAVVPVEQFFPAGFAAFDATPARGRAPLLVHFTDRSRVRSPSAWSWDFGDGVQSSEQHPEHVYTRVGMYDVRLVVDGLDGTVSHRVERAVHVGVTTPGGGPDGPPH